MDKITITLYDVVGYVIPGFLSLICLAVFFAFLTGNPVCLVAFYDINIVWQIGVAYIVGHLVQAIVSIIWKSSYDVGLDNSKINPQILSKFKEQNKDVIESEEVGHYDILFIENKIVDDRILTKVNIFRAFQGLYKGIVGVISLCIVGVVYLLIFHSVGQFTIKNMTISMSKLGLCFFLVVLIGMLFVSIVRHNAFVRSRLRTIVSYYVGRNV